MVLTISDLFVDYFWFVVNGSLVSFRLFGETYHLCIRARMAGRQRRVNISEPVAWEWDFQDLEIDAL